MNSLYALRSLGFARIPGDVARRILLSIIAVAVVVLSPLPASAAGQASAIAVSDAPASGPGFTPSRLNDVVSVMVQMSGQPAAIAYADSLKAAAAKAGVGSVLSLAPAARDAAIQAAVAVAKGQVAQNEAAQQAILPTLNSMARGGKVIFRTKSAYNGVSLYVTRDQIPDLRKLAGVKDVHVQIPKFHTAVSTDIDFVNTRAAWTKITPPSFPYGIHGESIKVADIDSGLDYIHTNFGGPGTPAAYASVTDAGPVPNPYFPTFKIPGGYDFAGDAYTGGNTPVPDANPMDSSNGHGTSTASLIAGLGVNADGTTFVGVYDNTTPISSMKISPGFAPKALLYPLRVFGTSGSTNLVTQAIDWAVDPNGDGNIADHMDVINMSLGSNTGDVNDPDCVAATNAAAAGVIVASAAGNAGDSYYIVSSPSVATGTLSVAASFNDIGGYFYNSNVTGNAPPVLAGVKSFSIYGSPNGPVGPGGLAGDVIYAIPNDGSSGGVPVANLTNAAAISGNICLIDRGVIGFANKVDLCQRAGATATIVVQSAAGSGTPYPIAMSLSGPPTSTIPAVMIGLNEGAAIKAQLGVGVNVTINNDNGFFSAPSTAADTMASYSARGPRAPDSMLKPDITAVAEVVGTAASLSGNKVGSFNGTSSATPHIAGIMSLLRQLHPTWTVDELNSLVTNTATHDLFTGAGGTGNQYGTGRVGAGRVDVANAVKANVVAHNQTDPGLYSISFGIVEVPVASTKTLTKNITLSNKGTSDVTYNVSYADATPLAGATFTVGSGGTVTVPAGGTMSVPVKFDATGNLLKHVREASVPANLPSARQWLTEKTGYAVFTPTSGPEPTLRVALYAAPKPVSSMGTTPPAVTTGAPSGTFPLALAGTPVNTGASFPTDIISLAKPYELQYTSPMIALPPPDSNLIKYVGVTSDYVNRVGTPQNTVIAMAYETFAPNTTPDFFPGEKDVYFDVNGDGVEDFAVFFSSLANGTANSNAYRAVLVNLTTFAQTTLTVPTNLLQPSAKDTNTFNNSVVNFAINASQLGLAGAAQPTRFSYYVVSFDRAGNFADYTGWLSYDLANPGLGVEGAGLEPFYLDDVATTVVNVNYNGVNKQLNDSQGVMMVHMHNASNAHVEAIPFSPPIANLFWRHHDDFNYRWLMSGTMATSLALPVVSGPTWTIAGIGDIDDDGLGDVVWFHQPSGAVYAWLMNGTTIKPGGVVPVGDVTSGWTIEAVADLNGDGVADILWRHTSGLVIAWYLKSDATIGSTATLGSALPAEWRVAGTGDLDGNGTRDIIWSYEVAGPVKGTAYAWMINAAGAVSGVSALGMNGGKTIAKVGDFDGDGKADLLWRDDPSGSNEVWYMNGTVVSAMQSVPSVATGYQAAATGDFNSDGKSDLLWFLAAPSGALEEWTMNGRSTPPTITSLSPVGPNWFLPGQ